MTKFEKALERIAKFIIPVYEMNGEKYVKFDHVKALRDIAREALKNVKRS